ncbi:Oidioi.mRNA.OKI2018_I69.chr2.g6707.t1.cds [Oikopleura dioica]|uniref:Oidioi.mRNA.OKI2018_I69.chr2.g6707.t1.cds n=1 Tax=Oikopleura dioica TaxID=34765 RepID=A0ABN7T8N2_OIKDI|nr:Oidioi.mRNA.OKI2018_I69.chr2.g6707.t1.cds [Oikopleura dioica]
MKLLLLSLITATFSETNSIFDERFDNYGLESSGDDDFDIDAIYTVFGNDTPERGDSRYKPPDTGTEQRSEANQLTEITDGIGEEVQSIWSWLSDTVTDAFGEIKDKTEQGLSDAQKATKEFFDNAKEWNNDQWNSYLQDWFTDEKDMVVLEGVCKGIENGSANLTTIENIENGKTKELLEDHCRAIKAREAMSSEIPLIFSLFLCLFMVLL